MKRTMRVLSTAVLLALTPVALAQSSTLDTQVTTLDATAANRGQAQVAQKIASNFTDFAGSNENALALVKALRAGDTVKLSYAGAEGATPTVTTVDPPTSKMGWGNVKISLALAQDTLARAGITNPTGEQLQAALNGGEITVKNADGTTSTMQLKGILQMRADGMGWGEIAKASGTKVGPVVSQLKMANTKVRALPPTEGTSAAPAPASKAVRTAGGETPTTPKSRGITTAAGNSGAHAGGKASKGITTASGAPASHGAKGIVSAEGAVSSTGPKGNGYGRGVVTAAGGSATSVAATGAGNGHGRGAGVVTAGGGSASSGVTTAHGGGNGKGQGQGNGKGRGGG